MTAVAIIPPSPNGGHQLTVEDARRGALAAQDARRARIAVKAERHDAINRLLDGLETEQIGPAAALSAFELMTLILDTELPAPASSLDVVRYAQAAEVLFKTYRLATGQSTSNAASLSVDVSDLAARKQELIARMTGTVDTAPRDA